MNYFVRVIFVALSVGIFASGALAEEPTQAEKMEALCKKGNSTACFKLGERYRILDRDTKKALEYYAIACEAGYMTGCTNGGIILAMKGTPYSKDFKQAREMFAKACEAGEDQSCFNMGTLNYKEGRQSKAIKYYKKACGMGNQAGCAREKRLNR